MIEEELSPTEWNSEQVADDELVASCYWEYARESAFILDVKRRCIDSQCQRMMNGEVWAYWGKDLERIQFIGYPAEVFLRGFTIGPDVERRSKHPEDPECRPSEAPLTGGIFPFPWQSLSEKERKARSRIGSDRTRIPLVPFGRGPSFFARWIGEHCDRQRATTFAKQASVKAANPDLTESQLHQRKMLKSPRVRPSLCTVGGEIGVFEIEWGHFTDDEIVNYFRKWARANRPARYPAPNGQGHKPRDWRVALERLGMMRLLHQLRLRDMPLANAAAWKLYGKREWYKERKRAGEMFRRLFPFLGKEDRPLSWPTKGGRSKV